MAFRIACPGESTQTALDHSVAFGVKAASVVHSRIVTLVQMNTWLLLGFRPPLRHVLHKTHQDRVNVFISLARRVATCQYKKTC